MRILILPVLLSAGCCFAAAAPPARNVDLYCHRTANRDVPENTLESLETASRLGCDVVEIDVRRSLDGVLVLNHDGFLERLTNGTGEIETRTYDELRLLDFGQWMGPRFAGMHVATLEDALRLARRRHTRLILDIKSKGLGRQIVNLLRAEEMLQQVEFNGEWEEIRQIEPSAHTDAGTWVSPGVTPEKVAELHRAGKRVIANFSANIHEMDLPSMKAAVAAGVDGINVDYPSVGAEAVGRPVEARLAELKQAAHTGDTAARLRAIEELSRYSGYPLRPTFLELLQDRDAAVSRAAAVALVSARPRTQYTFYLSALHSETPSVRANAAWALGMSSAPTSVLLPLLQDHEITVLQETLLALSRVSGPVGSAPLLRYLNNPAPEVRGAAALALAKHAPRLAVTAIAARLHREEEELARQFREYESRGKLRLTQAEIDTIVAAYRCHMKFVQALASIPGPAASRALAEIAYRLSDDFSQMDGLVAGYNLWDRAYEVNEQTKDATSSSNPAVRDRGQWVLQHALKPQGPAPRRVRVCLRLSPNFRGRDSYRLTCRIMPE